MENEDGNWVDISLLNSIYQVEMDVDSANFRTRHRIRRLGGSEEVWSYGEPPNGEFDASKKN